MIEEVGNLKLNLAFYEGKDYYSDGAVEDTLLEMVKKYTTVQLQKIIYQEVSWPILYHLSPIRENIVNWFPFKKKGTLLEVGAGCGAITGCFAKQLKKVCAIELSKKRSLINAHRNKNYDNIEIIVGNFEKIAPSIEEKFDYVTLIGVFEYAAMYISSSNPYSEFLNRINDMLKEGGKILLAIENRFGLKYFAGCREDHLGEVFTGIEGYSYDTKVRTFNRNEMIQLLEENGFLQYEFYYPYSDYKLPHTIYSDKYLPKSGELIDNMRNFDMDRWVLFDETKAFQSIISSGMFREFSNSFFIIIERKE